MNRIGTYIRLLDFEWPNRAPIVSLRNLSEFPDDMCVLLSDQQRPQYIDSNEREMRRNPGKALTEDAKNSNKYTEYDCSSVL